MEGGHLELPDAVLCDLVSLSLPFSALKITRQPLALRSIHGRCDLYDSSSTWDLQAPLANSG